MRDQLVAETGGNPLALLEWPRALTTSQWSGGFGLPAAVRLPGGVAEGFRRRLEVLPEQTRRLLLIAAADPLGDAGMVWRAGARLGIDGEAAEPAIEDGLVEFGTRVLFRHPVVRSVVYTSASMQERRVHGALAEVTDPRLDPDRRAWHRAHAAAGPDEDVAAELVGSAGRAQARGGLAAAAAFLERATDVQKAAREREIVLQHPLGLHGVQCDSNCLFNSGAGAIDRVEIQPGPRQGTRVLGRAETRFGALASTTAKRVTTPGRQRWRGADRATPASAATSAKACREISSPLANSTTLMWSPSLDGR